MALTLACLLIVGSFPVASADQPVDKLTLAAYSTQGGAATLYYEASTDTYSVAYTLLKGEIDARGPDKVDYTWTVSTWLYWTTDGAFDSNHVVACFNTADNSTTSGQEKTNSKTVVLDFIGCGTGPSFLPSSVPPNADLNWVFAATFMSTSYDFYEEDPSWWEKALHYGAKFYVKLRAFVAGIGVAAACGIYTGATIACAVAGELASEAVEFGGNWVVDQLLPLETEEGHKVYITGTTLLNNKFTILGTPRIDLSYACTQDSPGGTDTWNIVERVFYNRPPGQYGVGVTYPYDYDTLCVDVFAQNAYLGITGLIADEIDDVIVPTITAAPQPGDGPHQYYVWATDVHHVEWEGFQAEAGGAEGTYHVHIAARWDYEWKFEKDQGSQNPVLPGSIPTSDEPPSCVTCSPVSPTHDPNVYQAETLVYQFLTDHVWQDLNSLDPNPVPFDGQNLMVATATGNGLTGGVTQEALLNLPVHFDVIPRIDCVWNCPDGGAQGPSNLPGLDQLLGPVTDLVCPESPGDKLGPCVEEFLDEHQVHVPDQFMQRAHDQQHDADQGAPGGFFVLSGGPAETGQVVQEIWNLYGTGQHVLVVVDAASVDWAAYAAENGLALISSQAAVTGDIPQGVLITIVEQEGA